MVAGREDVTFTSGHGEDRADCAAWLYRPDGDAATPRPLIVLAHGLGAVRTMRLDEYGTRFATAGYAALVFDYRHFGDSAGMPRQLLDIGRQREDWHSAIAFARRIDGVDPDKICLFGTSFAGGHVIAVGAADPGVAAIISQCPFTNGLASGLTLGPKATLGVAVTALRDLLASIRGKEPVLVPLAGAPGETALMNAPDVVDGYFGLVPAGQAITNGAAGRVGLRIPLSRPGRLVKKIAAPILFCVCDADTVAPPGPTLKYAAQARNGTVRRYPFGHFDIYVGDPFEKVITDQIAFLHQEVPVSA
ncbi:MAG: alpha/beta fold hydrolase [Mycobacterium sp.]|nr:alpha/beta fold hydrolase [Mycobacterium sp.]